MHTKFDSENMNRINQFEDLGVHWSIKLIIL
jgi:hypothetical protein